ncbi:hypothetical protein BJV82DRAFT_600027 [Fennellomyces sp. T-0311]|nr:hypothetical protein BJV82DRAFT_600027 [Fennellomyces sp. T-0311]
MDNNNNDLFDASKDDDDSLVDTAPRTLPDNVSIGSPSTASPSVRSLALSPEDERRTTRTSISMSRGNTRQRASSDNTAALIGHHLTSSTAFYDIPVNDAFSELVERYIPPDQRPQRNVGSAENPEGVVNLVSNNMWRAVARYARQQLVQSNPNELDQILQLWHLRLLALTKLGLYQLASAEMDKLGDLNRPELTYEFHNIPDHYGSMVPFELHVLWACLPAWLKYPLVSLERLTMLAVHCKKMGAKSAPGPWRQREVQVYLVTATQMMEMNDLVGAANTMEMVLSQFGTKDGREDMDVLSALGRLYLQLGDVEAAERVYGQIEKDAKDQNTTILETIQMNKAFLYIAKGEWREAAEVLQKVLDNNKENLVVVNNLAVCQVYMGQLSAAINLLSTMTLQNPTSAGTCETAVMNLCTLYELRHDPATGKKVDVMKQVARWVGDSFQADCIKLQ